MDVSPEWVPVGELAAAMATDSHTLSPVEDLAGRRLELHFAAGGDAIYDFSSSTLCCETTGAAIAELEPRQFEAPYRATSLRPGIYFVDYVVQRDPARTVSLVLDFVRGRFTLVLAEMPRVGAPSESPLMRVRAGLELTPVITRFRHGSIAPRLLTDTRLHEETRELIGKRILYLYSPTEAYEHVYLNDRFYTWHCVRGLEAGLCDTDRCHYYRIDERLYLFVWREKIIPTAGVVMVDLERNKTSGKIFGYSGNSGEGVSNFPVGAFAKALNETTYD